MGTYHKGKTIAISNSCYTLWSDCYTLWNLDNNQQSGRVKLTSDDARGRQLAHMNDLRAELAKDKLDVEFRFDWMGSNELQYVVSRDGKQLLIGTRRIYKQGNKWYADLDQAFGLVDGVNDKGEPTRKAEGAYNATMRAELKSLSNKVDTVNVIPAGDGAFKWFTENLKGTVGLIQGSAVKIVFDGKHEVEVSPNQSHSNIESEAKQNATSWDNTKASDHFTEAERQRALAGLGQEFVIKRDRATSFTGLNAEASGFLQGQRNDAQGSTRQDGRTVSRGDDVISYSRTSNAISAARDSLSNTADRLRTRRNASLLYLSGEEAIRTKKRTALGGIATPR